MRLACVAGAAAAVGLLGLAALLLAVPSPMPLASTSMSQPRLHALADHAPPPTEPGPHRHAKFFHEPRGVPHMDARFASNASLPRAAVQAQLRRLLGAWAAFIDRSGGVETIPWWLAYGTLLGAWRNGDIIPWDTDADVAMLRRDLLRLPLSEHIEADTYFERNPNAGDTSVADKSNTVDARVICTQTGTFVDIFAYHPRADAAGLLVNKCADAPLPAALVFPLGRIRFGAMQLPAPNASETILHQWYGDLSAPDEVGPSDDEVEELGGDAIDDNAAKESGRASDGQVAVIAPDPGV
jgi:hypothetical protein